jgi:hypothetical protein
VDYSALTSLAQQAKQTTDRVRTTNSAATVYGSEQRVFTKISSVPTENLLWFITAPTAPT